MTTDTFNTQVPPPFPPPRPATHPPPPAAEDKPESDPRDIEETRRERTKREGNRSHA